MSAKAPEAFRTISEVSDLLDTPPHVLRFWETKFAQLKPVKRAGGRRYYRPQDVALIAGIKQLLHEDGLTIRGAQKILREKGVRHVAELAPLPMDESSERPDEAAGIEHVAAPKVAAVADAPPAPTEPPAPQSRMTEPSPRAAETAEAGAVDRSAPSAAPQEPSATPPPAAGLSVPRSSDAAAMAQPANPAPEVQQPLAVPSGPAATAPAPASSAPAPTFPAAHSPEPQVAPARTAPEVPPPPRVASLLRGVDPERLAGRQGEIRRVQERIGAYLDRLAEASGAGRR